MSNAPRHSVIQTAIKRKHISPCKNCTERSVGCHGSCERYAEYKDKIKSESAVVFEAYKNERLLDTSNTRAKQKQIQSCNRGGYAKWSAYRRGANQ